MNSHKTRDFDLLLETLPDEIQDQAGDAYRTWMGNPRHPGLHFERIRGSNPPMCSVRITRNYRAVGIYAAPDTVVWFWIGPHAEYDRVIGRS